MNGVILTLKAIDDQVGGQGSFLIVHGNFVVVEILTDLIMKTSKISNKHTRGWEVLLKMSYILESQHSGRARGVENECTSVKPYIWEIHAYTISVVGVSTARVRGHRFLRRCPRAANTVTSDTTLAGLGIIIAPSASQTTH